MSEAQPNAETQERTEGPTPNGGAYAIAFFQDAEGEPVAKDQAAAAEIIEFDEKDEPVFRTYGLIGGRSEAAPERTVPV